MVVRSVKYLIAATLLLTLAACGDAGESPVSATDPSASRADLEEMPSPGELLPMPFQAIWHPWHGDWEGMVERRLIRAVVPFDGYQF